MAKLERNNCPVCSGEETLKPEIYTKPGVILISIEHPYVECTSCGFWYQKELIDKVYMASNEKSGDTMDYHERRINQLIAEELYFRFLKDKSDLTALDIGAKFPWLMHSLALVSEGRVKTWAIDGIPEIEEYCIKYDLKVNGRNFDFEGDTNYPWGDTQFDLITMVHIIEHFYYPIKSMRKVHSILKPDGKLFIRCPSSDVVGMERDLTPEHYTIHLSFWDNKSLETMAKIIGFNISFNKELSPGQRDLILEKI